MSTEYINRQPAGIPSGGQFATTPKPPPDVTLAPTEDEIPGALNDTAIATCPACGTPRTGHVGAGRFLPRVPCAGCGDVNDLVTVTGTNGVEYTLREGRIVRTEPGGDYSKTLYPGLDDTEEADAFSAACEQFAAVGLDPVAIEQACLIESDPASFINTYVRAEGDPIVGAIFHGMGHESAVGLSALLDTTSADYSSHFETYVDPALEEFIDMYPGDGKPLSDEASQHLNGLADALADTDRYGFVEFVEFANAEYGALTSDEVLSWGVADAMRHHDIHLAPVAEGIGQRTGIDHIHSVIAGQYEVTDLVEDPRVATALREAFINVDNANLDPRALRVAHASMLTALDAARNAATGAARDRLERAVTAVRAARTNAGLDH